LNAFAGECVEELQSWVWWSIQGWAVFGDYISIYVIQSAVADNTTVKIYFESRI